MKPFSQAFGKWGPIVLSGAAIILLLVALTTGWERGLKDEGAVAHTWQLLIALQVPLVAVFLVTTDWRKPRTVVSTLALQAVALGLALAPVFLLHL